ncbi:MAG: hypothetical protein HY569_02125 [Candidatus Magasanikbacteria bacterium]|nr:hypothetical protein [Candidatus Magasanikbacteria bacterium]
MEIIPSVLVQTEEQFLQQMKGLGDSVKQIQLDIADGKFVPNVTWANPTVVKKLRKLNVELHLMVADPLAELKKWIGVKQVKRVLFHYESQGCHPERPEGAEGSLSKIINFAKKNNWQVGIVLNPDTPISAIEPFLNQLDAVMFMGVHPGFQGQSLIKEVLTKITKFTTKYPKIFTEIDGAVNESNLPDIVKTGVNAICPGSATFKVGKPVDNIKQMKLIIGQNTETR